MELLPLESTFISASDEETIELGRRLAQILPARGVVLLIGNLGAGKTTLSKGIIAGRGLGEPHDVVSPTFTLIHEYGPNAKGERVYHIDLYRLDHVRELATLGLEEIFDQNALVLIEWGERFPEIMPEDRIEIRLTPQAGSDQRVVTLHQLSGEMID